MCREAVCRCLLLPDQQHPDLQATPGRSAALGVQHTWSAVRLDLQDVCWTYLQRFDLQDVGLQCLELQHDGLRHPDLQTTPDLQHVREHKASCDVCAASREGMER